MDDPLETSELLAFSKAVEARSLSRAAAELGVPRATISRRLARLEERLGVRLLRRTTRSLALTDAGEALHRHARIVLDAVHHAEASVRKTDDAVRGELRVSVPPMTGTSFSAMICDFSRRYPEVRLHVHSTTQHVDLQRGGYDVALRAATALEPGLVARTLAREPTLAVASPAYLEAHGTPRSRRDLRHHRCLMGFARGELPQTHWPFAGGKFQIEGALFANDVYLLCDAALEGLGIALLPLILASPHLESGALVHVLPNALQGESHIAVVYPEREFMPPQVRAFIDALVAWAPELIARANAPMPKRAAKKRGGKSA
ncbi:LysR family transcriptional regulator [Polyangium jinanense]|uniref:LysR family transcriptional regulator n=1 Tax=Polyangium jinanense TaxID=2829994 RepID=A0A9X4ARK8_9BACT|nr:LysR family transcriptional regulator [Polyangium jinanense]MDC3955245.1 LysR family transcriptional regulator [Polyangium jinanense]MDC3981546.1 LysR family transcriptional regulator [Polyangium jinanense]